MRGMILLAAAALLAPAPAHAFRTLGYKWANLSPTTPLCWAVDPDFPSGSTITQAEVEDVVEAGVVYWEAVTTSFITFEKCPFPSGVEPYAGSYTVVIHVESSLSSGTDAVAGQGGCASYEDAPADPFYHCDAGRMNLSATVLESGATGVESVVAHEMGHVLGLHHSEKPSIMSYHRRASTLTSDDWAGLSYIYPGDGTRDEYAPLGCGTVSSGGGGGPRPPGPEALAFPLLVIAAAFAFSRRRFLDIFV